MKDILLINPSMKKDVLTTVYWMTFPPLNLAYLKELTNPDRYRVTICDENVHDLGKYLHNSYHLVGITSITSTAPRAYEIAGMFRDQGTPVIMGGIHASMVPEEAKRYVDCVVIGEAEGIWLQILRDFEDGQLHKQYVGGPARMSGIPVLKHRYNRHKYFISDTLQTARGCPMDCDFCSVTKFNGGIYRQRPIRDVLQEISFLHGRIMFFVDDSILGYGKKAEALIRELFKGIVDRGIKKKWASQVSINIADSEDTLYWAAKSGAKAFFIGLESLNEKVLKSMGKHLNLRRGIKNYRKIIEKIHDYGISVVAGFIFGNDEDDKDVFKRTAEFVIESKLDGAQYTMATPLPGTDLFNRLWKEGRILYKNFPHDWRYFDIFHVTFQPRNFDPVELCSEVSKMYRLTNGPVSALRKAFGTLEVTKDLTTTLFALGLNIGYWRGYKNLDKRL